MSVLTGCREQTVLLPANTAKTVITDEAGKSSEIPLSPQRVVSLTLSSDEMLAALLPPSRIAALSYLAEDGEISNIAADTKNIPKTRVQIEQIITFKPDLVVTSDIHPAEVIETLRDAGIPVYVYKVPVTIEQIKETIRKLGQVVHETGRAAEVVADMDKQLKSVRKKLAGLADGQRKRVLRFSLQGGGGGSGSLFDDICRYAEVDNAANLVGITRHQLLSKEQIVMLNPDVFFVPSWDYTKKTDPDEYKGRIRSDPALQTVKAIRQDKIVMLPDRHLVCASQYIVFGVREVAETVYPDLFEEQP